MDDAEKHIVHISRASFDEVIRQAEAGGASRCRGALWRAGPSVQRQWDKKQAPHEGAVDPWQGFNVEGQVSA